MSRRFWGCLMAIWFAFILSVTAVAQEITTQPTTNKKNDAIILDGFDADNTSFLDNSFTVSSKEKIFDIWLESELLAGVWLKGPETNSFEEDIFSAASMKFSFDLNIRARKSGWTFFTELNGNHDFAATLNNAGYTDSYCNDIEKNAEIKELWLQKDIISNLDLKVGRQIIAWGVSSSLRVTDVLNPVDNSWPGLTDIEDRRLPVTMTRLNLFSEATDLTVAAIHEVRMDDEPEYGSPFYIGEISGSAVTPSSTLENTQWGASLGHNFKGVDSKAYFASFWDFDSSVNFSGDYPLVTMFGASIMATKGDFVFKAETAYFDGKKYTGALNSEKKKFDILAGIEFTGVRDTSIVVEVLNRHIFDFENQMDDYGYKEDEVLSLFKVERKFFNDTLVLSCLSTFGGVVFEDGGFIRFNTKYSCTDELALEVGLVQYFGGESTYYETIEDNDLIFLKLLFNFDVN